MGQLGNHFEASWPVSLVYLVILILSCIKIQGSNLLSVATFVVGGNETDQQALLELKSKINGDQLEIMQSWNSTIHFCLWHGVTCGHRHQSHQVRLAIP
ncbi:hypothetical protein CRYUN_Cryun41cG0008100 [Craigia yunnanensis]